MAVAATYDAGTGTLISNTPLPDGAHTITYGGPAGGRNESGQSGALNLIVVPADTAPTLTSVAFASATQDEAGSFTVQ